MIVSIHQPGYWPWLGLLDKIAKSDLYVALDDVAASRDAYQFRNIFLVNGTSKFLTIPTDYRMGRAIRELRFRDPRWAEDHLGKLRAYYRQAPYFREVFPAVEALYQQPDDSVADHLLRTMKFCLDFLDIRTPIRRSSEMAHSGSKGQLVLDLCVHVGADSYLSGQGAREYMMDVLPSFKTEGIQILWQTFSHPTYPQFTGAAFVQGLASLDMFFFLGREQSRSLFWSSLKSRAPWEAA